MKELTQPCVERLCGVTRHCVILPNSAALLDHLTGGVQAPNPSETRAFKPTPHCGNFLGEGEHSALVPGFWNCVRGFAGVLGRSLRRTRKTRLGGVHEAQITDESPLGP